MEPSAKRPKKNSVETTYDMTIGWETEEEYAEIIEKLDAWCGDATRLQASREIAPSTGKPHLQVKVTWRVGKRWTQMKKLMGNHHFERSVSKCFAYTCKLEDKDELVITHDSRAPGARSDLVNMKAMIDSGCSKLELWEEHFGSMARYHSAMSKYAELKNKHTPRPKLEVEWIIGPSGSGKSTKAEEQNPNAYWLSQDGTDAIWWDGYDGEEVVVIDDFRPSMFRYEQLLKLLNSRGSYRLGHKGGSSWLLARKFVITSVQHPKDMYTEYDTQLSRRITKVTEL